MDALLCLSIARTNSLLPLDTDEAPTILVNATSLCVCVRARVCLFGEKERERETEHTMQIHEQIDPAHIYIASTVQEDHFE